MLHSRRLAVDDTGKRVCVFHETLVMGGVSGSGEDGSLHGDTIQRAHEAD